MSRSPVSLRTAGPDDAAALLELWSRADSPAHARATAETSLTLRVAEAAGALAHVAADPSQQLIVAEAEGRLVGAMHLRRAPMSPLQLEEIVHVSHLHVLPEVRRRGIASMLLDAAAAWAEEKDSEHVIAIAASTNRDAQRFLARLGFGQVAVVRGAAVAQLRQRCLGPADRAVRETSRLLHVRRSLRRRGVLGS